VGNINIKKEVKKLKQRLEITKRKRNNELTKTKVFDEEGSSNERYVDNANCA
jgi:hypothetical protein